MESFEQLAEQYKPMIHRIIHSLKIYHDQEEFYQTGLIALWEASKGFDERKGKFSSYAYSYIKGRLLSELAANAKQKERTFHPKEEYWGTIKDLDSTQPLETELLLSYCTELTEKETKWVLASCLYTLTTKEIAENEHVSVSAVKQWRSSAKRKIGDRLLVLLGDFNL